MKWQIPRQNDLIELAENARFVTPSKCNVLQHTATHCNTLQHTATHCKREQTHALLRLANVVSPLHSTRGLLFPALPQVVLSLVVRALPAGTALSLILSLSLAHTLSLSLSLSLCCGEMHYLQTHPTHFEQLDAWIKRERERAGEKEGEGEGKGEEEEEGEGEGEGERERDEATERE